MQLLGSGDGQIAVIHVRVENDALGKGRQQRLSLGEHGGGSERQ